MGDKEKPSFDVVRPGCVRFTPSLEVLLLRWARGCDEDPHSGARHILQASGYPFRSVGGKHYAVGLACPACEAAQVTERGEAPTPSCFLVPGSYRPKGSTPTSVQCAACGHISKPSILAETLYDSKPARLAFLRKHCGGSRPREWRWVAARHDGKVAVAADAESAMDHAAADTFPPEMELCLLLGIEQPIDAAELELPFVKVALSERGEIKTLGWHGERPSVDEQARYHTWHRAASRERQKEIERRTRLATAELEREVQL